MKNINKQNLLFLIGIIFMFLLIKTIYNNRKGNNNILYETAIDSLNHYKDKDNRNIAKIAVLETFNVKALIRFKTDNETIKELKTLVKEHKKKLKIQGSATIIKSETNIQSTTKTEVIIAGVETIVPNDTIVIYPIYKSSIINKWYNISSISTKDSTSYKLSIYSNLSLIIGRESQGLFKKRKTYAIASDKNPYTNIKDMRVYQIKLPKPKRIGLGVYSGYGINVINSEIKTGFQIGIGINYNLIEW